MTYSADQQAPKIMLLVVLVSSLVSALVTSAIWFLISGPYRDLPKRIVGVENFAARVDQDAFEVSERVETIEERFERFPDLTDLVSYGDTIVIATARDRASVLSQNMGLPRSFVSTANSDPATLSLVNGMIDQLSNSTFVERWKGGGTVLFQAEGGFSGIGLLGSNGPQVWSIERYE